MAQYVIDNMQIPIDFSPVDIIQRTVQNAKNLLMCRMGEVPYDRSRGFNFALFDLPKSELDTELLPELDRLMIWEPDAEVVSADSQIMPDGSTYIRVVIDVPIGEDTDDEEA